MPEFYMILPPPPKKKQNTRFLNNICPKNHIGYFCPKHVQILHNNCPKNIFSDFFAPPRILSLPMSYVTPRFSQLVYIPKTS